MNRPRETFSLSVSNLIQFHELRRISHYTYAQVRRYSFTRLGRLLDDSRPAGDQLRQRREEATGGASERGVVRGPRVRARPCCFTHASRLLRKEDPPREGERGRRARAVPERPRSFLSYPENRSLRHAALDDRHRITRVHHRIDRRSNLHRATLFHARTYTRAHTRTRTHTTYTTFRCCALNFRSRAPIPFRSSSFPLICLSYSYSSLLRSLPSFVVFPSFNKRAPYTWPCAA